VPRALLRARRELIADAQLIQCLPDDFDLRMLVSSNRDGDLPSRYLLGMASISVTNSVTFALFPFLGQWSNVICFAFAARDFVDWGESMSTTTALNDHKSDTSVNSFSSDYEAEME